MFEPKTSYGTSFLVPYLNETGIVVSDLTYEWRKVTHQQQLASRTSVLSDTHTQIMETVVRDIKWEPAPTPVRYVFDFPKNSVKLGEKEGIGMLWEIPATPNNLRKLMELPLVSEDSKARASEQLLRWDLEMERRCLSFILQKADTEPASKYGFAPDGSAHLVPVRSRKVSTEVVRKMTDKERARFLRTGDMPSRADLTSRVESVEASAHLTHWYKYARSKTPYSQQLTGAEMLYQMERLAIWYDMRTGKTLLAQMVAKRLLTEGAIDHVLIVCPRPNMYKPWAPEMELEGFDCRILDGTYDEDAEQIRQRNRYDWPQSRKPDAFIINYERVGSRLPLMTNNWDLSRVMVIADESSLIKNPSSKRTRALHALCDDVRYVTLLNGTPAEQGPEDVWAQMRCLDQYGVRWGQTFGQHEDKFLTTLANGKVVPTNRMSYEMLIATTSIRYVRGEADQHSGKDKSFRYVQLKGTKQMIDQSENVRKAGVVQLKDGSVQDVSQCVLALYMMLREICCGYDKFREVEHGPFIRDRHEIDPKLLWVRCFLEANPTEPLVVYCEFNEQEERLKEMLDEMKIKWSSTKSRGRYQWRQRIKEGVDPFHRGLCYEAIRTRHEEGVAGLAAKIEADLLAKGADPLAATLEAVTLATTEYANDHGPLPDEPSHIRYYEPAIEWFRNNYPWELEDYHGYAPGKKHSPRDRAYQMDLFNEGETHVFILKTAEGRGIELSRKEAVSAGIGTYPTMIFLAPCWSLGMWDQAQDRCVTSDPKTGKNVCTMIYALGIKGSIESLVYTALRNKKDVQQTLLQDTERKGFNSFLEDLIEGMKSGAADTDDSEYFDAEEMTARITCGVPPYSKLTPSLILNKVHDKLGHKTRKQTEEWLDEPEEGLASLGADSVGKLMLVTKYDAGFRDGLRAAYAYLLSRVKDD